jgi:hypothetical protein
MILAPDSWAHDVWRSIVNLFRDSHIQHTVLLQQEFYSMCQNDMSIHAYATRLKLLAKKLCEVAVSDIGLLTNLIRGLNREFGQAASNLSLLTEPTFAHATTYPRLEEHRMQNVARQEAHSVLMTGTSCGPAPSPVAPICWRGGLI